MGEHEWTDRRGERWRVDGSGLRRYRRDREGHEWWAEDFDAGEAGAAVSEEMLRLARVEAITELRFRASDEKARAQYEERVAALEDSWEAGDVRAHYEAMERYARGFRSGWRA